MTSTTAVHELSGAEARRVARNAGAIAAARILSSAALFGWQLILGGWLGATEYGVYGTVGALFAIGVPVASFSMGMIIIRDTARAPDKAGRYLSAALVMQTVLALVAYVGVNAAAWVFGYSETIRAFAAVAALSLFIDLLGNLAYDQLIAREQMVTTSTVDVGHVVVRIGAAALLLTAGYGLAGVYAATLATGVARSLVLGAALWRAGVRPTFPVERRLAGGLLVNSAPLALSAFLSLAYQHTDKLMTTALLGETGTGYLTAAFVVIYGVVEILSTTILIATYPLMSRSYDSAGGGGGNPALFGFIVQKLTFFTLLVSVPLSLTVTVFAPALTTPLFGADFAPTADVLRVLIWYALLTMAANVLAQGLMVQNRQRWLLAIRAGGLAVNIALVGVFVPLVGVTGAAVASVCAEAAVLAALLAAFRADGLDWRRTLPRLVRLMMAAAAAAAVMLFFSVATLMAVVAGNVVYFAAVMMGRVLAADDWDLLYRLVGAMPGGSLVQRVWRHQLSE